MEERNASVDKERVTRDPITDDPVSRLVEAKPRKYPSELSALVEQNFEENRDSPHHESCHEECPRLVLMVMASPRLCFHSVILSL